MNTALITTLNKHYVYYINGSRLSFYIAIPYNDFKDTNITIELYKDYEKLNPNNNDNIWIKDEITKIYKEIDNDNISLVIPIFHDDRLQQTNNLMDQNLYLELDNNISSAINSAYQILSKSNIQVEPKINLINNGSFNNFTSWFLKRYSTRVELKNYSDLRSTPLPTNIQPPFENPVSDPNIGVASQTRIPLETPTYTNNGNNYPQQPQGVPNQPNNIAFVTGTNAPNNNQMVTPPTSPYMNNTPQNENVEVPQSDSAGFVSYLLLGIITVIICLGILYIML